MTTLWTCALAALLSLTDDAPAERLQTICRSLGEAPSATFEVGLPSLMEVSETKKSDGSTVTIGKGGKRQTLVIRRESGQPEHLRLDDAEIFRFSGNVLVGRLGDGAWEVIPPPAEPDGMPKHFRVGDGSTALDRLAEAARAVPFPSALLLQVKGEVREATASEKHGLVELEAWLNGHRPREKGQIVKSEARPTDVEENTRVVAKVRPDGTVVSIQVDRQIRRTVSDRSFMASGGHTFEPSEIGSTKVSVPPEVTALANG